MINQERNLDIGSAARRGYTLDETTRAMEPLAPWDEARHHPGSVSAS